VVEASGRTVRHVASGVIRLRGTREARLGVIFRTLGEFCDRFAPAAIVVEKTFVGDNIQSAFRLSARRAGR